MRFACWLALLLLSVLCFGRLRAQETPPELDLGALAAAAADWAEANLDEHVLQALPELDRKPVEDFLQGFESQLKGEYVIDVAKLKDAARLILPVLDAYEETAPSAAWLRARLDYFEVAEELRQAQPPVRGQAVTNPPPAVTKAVWVRKLRPTDWPKGAVDLVPKLKPVFAKEQVPPELVWLAEVESSFDPKARSPVGAAGLFQLMPATAKRFGLRSWPRDQRYQPEPSAQAAAKYLGLLGRQFGDWRLALAAYNSGEGTVQRLLAKYNANSFDGIAGHLPAETQMYVPKVEATVLKREGKELPEYSRSKKVKTAGARIPRKNSN